MEKRILEAIDRGIRKALSEDFIVNGVQVKSLVQPTMNQIQTADLTGKMDVQKITKQIQDIYSKMLKDPKYIIFMKQNNMQEDIQWSYSIDTACTDGFNGRLVMNPDFMKATFDKAGELGVIFVIVHETMHNYYNNVQHRQQIKTVADNINIDRMINKDIIMKWPELKDIPQKIGALL